MFQAIVNSRCLIVQIAKYPSMLVLKPTLFKIILDSVSQWNKFCFSENDEVLCALKKQEGLEKYKLSNF